MTSGYDEEKKTLTRRIAELSQEIDNATERSADVKRFVALVRKYTAIKFLHPFKNSVLYNRFMGIIENCLLFLCGWNPLFQFVGFGIAFEVYRSAD